MIIHAIKYPVEVGGIQITATRYRQIDETRAGHCQKAVRQPKVAKLRKIKKMERRAVA